MTFLGVKTYSDPSYILSGVKTPQPLGSMPLHYPTITFTSTNAQWLRLTSLSVYETQYYSFFKVAPFQAQKCLSKSRRCCFRYPSDTAESMFPGHGTQCRQFQPEIGSGRDGIAWLQLTLGTLLRLFRVTSSLRDDGQYDLAATALLVFDDFTVCFGSGW